MSYNVDGNAEHVNDTFASEITEALNLIRDTLSRIERDIAVLSKLIQIDISQRKLAKPKKDASPE